MIAMDDLLNTNYADVHSPHANEGVTSQSASVLDLVKFGGARGTVDGTIYEMWLGANVVRQV